MKKMLSAVFLVAFLAQTWSLDCLLCTDEYAPVCGQNGNASTKTFGNECELESYNCLNGDDYVIIGQDACSELALRDSLECDIVCTALYDPVCAENSKGEQRTFGNSCNVSQYNCENDDNFNIIYEGECNDK